MLDVIIIVLGLIVALVGIVGCIIPAVPGPPLNFVSLLLLEIIIDKAFSLEFYLVWGIITTLTILIDYILPIMGAKLYKASRWGIWGSVIGMLIGMIFFPPFGMIIGLLVGAIAGEFIAGKNSFDAFKVGAATFVASIIVILIKLIVSGFLTFFYAEKVISHYI